MAISNGMSATKIHGASPACAVLAPACWWIEQRPPEGHDAERAGQHHQDARADVRAGWRGRAARRHRRGAGTRHAGTASIAARTSSRVSHSSGARTLAICGAKTGRVADHVAGRPVGDDLAVGQHDGPLGHAAPPARRRASPARRRVPTGPTRASTHDEPVLARVVETAGRLVEQEKRWRRRQNHGEGQRESLAFREVARMAVHRHPREDPRPRWPGSFPPSRRGGAVGAATLVVDGFAVEEQPGILWHQAHRLGSARAGRRRCGSRPPDADRATCRAAPARRAR